MFAVREESSIVLTDGACPACRGGDVYAICMGVAC